MTFLSSPPLLLCLLLLRFGGFLPLFGWLEISKTLQISAEQARFIDMNALWFAWWLQSGIQKGWWSRWWQILDTVCLSGATVEQMNCSHKWLTLTLPWLSWLPISNRREGRTHKVRIWWKWWGNTTTKNCNQLKKIPSTLQKPVYIYHFLSIKIHMTFSVWMPGWWQTKQKRVNMVQGKSN